MTRTIVVSGEAHAALCEMAAAAGRAAGRAVSFAEVLDELLRCR